MTIFSFRAIVYDASGCLLYVKPAWAIDSGADQVDLNPNGDARVHPDAPEGEVRLTASVGGRSALVTIEIASSARYDALLKSGAFNADGEVDEAASVAIASQSIGAGDAVAEDTATRRKHLFVGLVVIIAALLAAGAALLFRQARGNARTKAAEDAARRARFSPPEPPAAVPLDPPVEPEPAAPRPNPKTICPICGKQYAAEARFCGSDGATLLPLN